MNIIVRTCGERTTNECIKLARKHGDVIVINKTPFAEAVKMTFLIGLELKQKWISVVDADVLLYKNVIHAAILELDKKIEKTFCLDGKTYDKILMKNRRAGIHIYRRDMLEEALKYIDYKHLKPESHVRREMVRNGYASYTGKIIFGLHDFEQYYCDLWRKAVLQTRKLARMIKKRPEKWKKLSKTDKDYLVIYRGHIFGKNYQGEMIIDKNIDFNASENIKKLGLMEKSELGDVNLERLQIQ